MSLHLAARALNICCCLVFDVWEPLQGCDAVSDSALHQAVVKAIARAQSTGSTFHDAIPLADVRKRMQQLISWGSVEVGAALEADLTIDQYDWCFAVSVQYPGKEEALICSLVPYHVYAAKALRELTQHPTEPCQVRSMPSSLLYAMLREALLL